MTEHPIDVVLYCPKCGVQHIDAPDPEQELTGTEHVHADPDNPNSPIVPRPYTYRGRPAGAWHNPPHRSHLCAGCGHIWRPSDHPTNGVLRTASGKDADCAPAVTRPARIAFEVVRASSDGRVFGNVIDQSVPDQAGRQLAHLKAGESFTYISNPPLGGIPNAQLCTAHGGTGPQPGERCPLCAAIDRTAYDAVAGK